MSVLRDELFVSIAESIGMEKLNSKVPTVLAPEVEYRMREIIDVASKFAQHGKRGKLTSRDINDALASRNIESLYGYGPGADTIGLICAEDNKQVSGEKKGFYVRDDTNVHVDEILNMSIPAVPLETNFHMHWLAIDGVQPNIPENQTVPKGSDRQKEDKQKRPLVKHVLSEEMQLFYTKLTEALTNNGSSVQHAAFTSLSMDNSVQQLVPYLSKFLYDQVRQNYDHLSILLVMMQSVRCLLRNPSLHLELYLHQLLPAILTCVVGKSLCQNPNENHWALREKAATIIASICARFGDRYENIQPRVSKTYHDALLDPSKLLTTHYGAIIGITNLGYHAVQVLILPMLETYLQRLTPVLTSKNPIQRMEAMHCYGCLVRAVGVYVRGVGNEGIHTFDATSSNNSSISTTLSIARDRFGEQLVPHLLHDQTTSCLHLLGKSWSPMLFTLRNLSLHQMLKASNALSTEWKVNKSHAGSYTGGKVSISEDGSFMACLYNEDVCVLEYTTGRVLFRLQDKVAVKEEITAFAIRKKHRQIITASSNLLLRIWDMDTLECLRTIKAHTSPILYMDVDSTGEFVATGSTDRSTRVFDIEKGFCTHRLNGHKGIVTHVQFHPEKLLLVSCGDDAMVKVWDLYTGKCVGTLKDHMSTVTSVGFFKDGWTMVTAGRDKVMNFWDLRRFVLLHTVPVYEALEGIQVVSKKFLKQGRDCDVVVTAGEKGQLKMYTCEMVKKKMVCTCVYTASNDALPYIGLELHDNTLMAITSQHNFVLYDAQFSRIKQMIGFNDEIIALKYIPGDSGKIAVATNSEQLRITNTSDLSSVLLSGHTEIIMAIAVSADGKWLVSVSKDKSVKLWDVQSEKCIATCIGHTEAIGAVAMSQKAAAFASGDAYFVTGSADKILKKWSMKGLKSFYGDGSEYTQPLNVANCKAHEKDINTLAISPNDRLIASGSQDKTIKIWSADKLALLGTCKGHKRGVWSVVFSPVDQCIASASGDKTIKLWSAKDYMCLKTFEGHTASTLNVQFVSSGMQLMSSGADGLIKLWTIRSNECENTFDQHEDKIWALDVQGDQMISGGGDSTIHLWKDVTEAVEQQAMIEREQMVLKEQELFNCLQGNEFQKAVKLAFDLGHPHKLLGILRSLIEGPKSLDVCNSPEKIKSDLSTILLELTDDQLNQLMLWIRDWNTNAKTSSVAQQLLTAMLGSFPPSKVKSLDKSHGTLRGLLAYSDRHFNRLDKLVRNSYLVDYTIVAMKRILPDQVEPESEPKRICT